MIGAHFIPFLPSLRMSLQSVSSFQCIARCCRRDSSTTHGPARSDPAATQVFSLLRFHPSYIPHLPYSNDPYMLACRRNNMPSSEIRGYTRDLGLPQAGTTTVKRQLSLLLRYPRSRGRLKTCEIKVGTPCSMETRLSVASVLTTAGVISGGWVEG
jgi:hypothetical protein